MKYEKLAGFQDDWEILDTVADQQTISESNAGKN